MSAILTFRFVDDIDLSSGFIRRAEFGLPWSHVEIVTESGLYYGARNDGGVKARPPGYMKFKAEEFVKVPCSAEQFDAANKFLASTWGKPYDVGAIEEMLLGVTAGKLANHPEWLNPTQPAYICSALAIGVGVVTGLLHKVATVRLATPRDAYVAYLAISS